MTTLDPKGRRRGFALVMAIGAIVVIGAMIAGVFYATTQEYRIGRNSLLQTRALTAAEFGLNSILSGGNWDGTIRSLALGQVVVRAFSPGDGSVDTVRVTRMTNSTYLVVSEAVVGSQRGAQARRRIGALVTMNAPLINIAGALTTRGETRIGGSSSINGTDTSYTGWGCAAAGATKPGIVLPSAGLITTSGCNDLSCVTGSPKVSSDPSAADTTRYTVFGSVTWADLAAMANVTTMAGATLTGIGPSYSGGACNMADPKNWGDVDKLGGGTACDDYYPIIYSPGDLKITTGMGQGILLVNGDLEIQGGFQFYGPVIIRGTLKTAGQGGHLNGGVMAANVELDQNTVLGNAVIRYSSCAITKALLGSATPGFARGRAWVDLF